MRKISSTEVVSTFENCEIFKENNQESKEVPSFPARYGDIETDKYCLEATQPCVGAFHDPAFPIHLLIEQIILAGINPVPPVTVIPTNQRSKLF